MEAISEAVRQQAIYPLSALPTIPGWKRAEGDHCRVMLHHFPFPQIVEPSPELKPPDVDDAIGEARARVREHNRDVLVWITGPDLPWLGDELARRGLRNEDSPGFESVENAMVLIEPPAAGSSDDVEVMLVDSFDAFTEGTRIELAAFEIPAEGRTLLEAEMQQRWNEYAVPNNPYRRWNAKLAGRVVGTAGGVLGPVGMNLFGGGVLADARGRGVYRALVRARWAHAVRLGTPALTVQAGRMSAPPLARLGFRLVATMPIYVDEFGDAAR